MWYVNIYKVEDTDDGLHVVRHFIRHVKSFKNKKLAVDLSVEVDHNLSLAGDVVSGEYRGGNGKDDILAVANMWLPNGRWAEEAYIVEVEDRRPLEDHS